MKYAVRVLIFGFILLQGCGNNNKGKSDEIIVFHAGSLSVPFRQMKEKYEQSNPGLKILLEPSGSLVCARKITELKKPCDIMASADYFVIDELLIPENADWSIRFATNEMVLAYNEKSSYYMDISSSNWIDIIMREDVIYARSDPDADPGGYRAVLTLMLAEKHYGRPGITEKLVLKDRDYMRPKEVDLIALMESYAIDYMFIYKSVALQHNLSYVELPDETNLSDPAHAEFYESVFLDVKGNKPGSRIRVKGEYINYSMTIPFISPNREKAIDFMCFILSDEGLEIFKSNGQDPIIPFSTEQPEKIPSKLLDYLPENKTLM